VSNHLPDLLDTTAGLIMKPNIHRLFYGCGALAAKQITALSLVHRCPRLGNAEL
jgi:hypothetical protein